MTIFRLGITNFVIIIMFLLGNGSCQTSPANGFNTRLFRNTPVYGIAKAVAKQDTLAIEGMLKNNPTLINYQEPKFGESLLDFAVITDKIHSVEKLLMLGSDPNLRSPIDNSTPFLNACRYSGSLVNSDEIIAILLNNGAKINSSQFDTAHDKPKITALELACYNGKLETVRTLIDNGADLTGYPSNEGSLVCAALLTDKLDVVKYLLLVKKLPVPEYCVIREQGSKFEKKITMIDLLNEHDYSNDGKKQKLKEELLSFLNTK